MDHEQIANTLRVQAAQLRDDIGDMIRSDGSMHRGEELAYLVNMAQLHATLALLQRLPVDWR